VEQEEEEEEKGGRRKEEEGVGEGQEGYLDPVVGIADIDTASTFLTKDHHYLSTKDEKMEGEERKGKEKREGVH